MPRGPTPGRPRGQYARVPDDVKRRLIAAVEDNAEDYVVVARTLGLNPSTARSVLLRHRAGHGVEDARGGRRQATVKLTPEVVQLVVEMVERQPDITLKVIKDNLEVAVPPVMVSVTSISRALDGQLITTKKLQDCPVQRNSVRIKRDRAVYAAWYLAQGKHSFQLFCKYMYITLHVHHVSVEKPVDAQNTLIFVDESCFNIFTRRTRGRAALGQPAVRQLNFDRGANLNLVMAVAPGTGVVYYELQRGTMTGQRFQHYLDNLDQILRDTEAVNPVIVLDNAPVHRGAVCGEALVKFLPAYSPFLNPIENCFSVFKLKLREVLREDQVMNRISAVPAGVSVTEHRIRVLHDLAANVLDDQSTISGLKVANMTSHVMTYMHRCSISADITV